MFPRSTSLVGLLALQWLVSCRYGYDPLDPSPLDAASLSDGGSGSVGSGGVGSASAVTGLGGSQTAGGTSSVGSAGTATTSSSAADPIDHCSELRHLGKLPTLDGELEPGMYLEPFELVGWKGDSASPPPGNSMKFSVGWYETGLYFYLEVTDPDLNVADPNDPVWHGDGIEIYVDHDAMYAPVMQYDHPGTFQLDVAAPADAASMSERAERYVPTGLFSTWSPGSWIGVPTSDGYKVEAFIVAADLDLPTWTLMPGAQVGFDLGHNISYPPGQTGIDGNREGQGFLKIREPATDPYPYPFLASDVFCTATLLAPQ